MSDLFTYEERGPYLFVVVADGRDIRSCSSRTAAEEECEILNGGAAIERARIRREMLETFGPHALRSDEWIATAEGLVDALNRICPEEGAGQPRAGIAGYCEKCDGPVFHRPLKPGEYDHACRMDRNSKILR